MYWENKKLVPLHMQQLIKAKIGEAQYQSTSDNDT